MILKFFGKGLYIFFYIYHIMKYIYLLQNESIEMNQPLKRVPSKRGDMTFLNQDGTDAVLNPP